MQKRTRGTSQKNYNELGKKVCMKSSNELGKKSSNEHCQEMCEKRSQETRSKHARRVGSSRREGTKQGSMKKVQEARQPKKSKNTIMKECSKQLGTKVCLKSIQYPSKNACKRVALNQAINIARHVARIKGTRYGSKLVRNYARRYARKVESNYKRKYARKVARNQA